MWRSKAQVQETKSRLELLDAICDEYYVAVGGRYFDAGPTVTAAAILNRAEQVGDVYKFTGPLRDYDGLGRWEDGKSYFARNPAASSTPNESGDVVVHENRAYECRQDHTAAVSNTPPNSTYWEEVGAVDSWLRPIRAFSPGTQRRPVFWSYGPDGINDCRDGNVPTWSQDHGAYTGDVPGTPGDPVIYRGQLYRCIQDHTSNISRAPGDTAYWVEVDDVGTFK